MTSRLIALFAAGFLLSACEPSLQRIKPDFADAFSCSLPDTARVVEARKEVGGYALYAVVELPPEEFSRVEPVLARLPRLGKGSALEVVAWGELKHHVQQADYVVESNSQKRLARCGILPRNHQLVFAIEYQ